MPPLRLIAAMTYFAAIDAFADITIRHAIATPLLMFFTR